MHLYDPLLDGSVIKRELLFHPQFFLTFLSEEETCINELVAHFENPVFALTMGSSDSLAKVYSVERENFRFTIPPNQSLMIYLLVFIIALITEVEKLRIQLLFLSLDKKWN